MVNNVISAVSVALHNEFGTSYRIYSDNVEQALIRPCFFINVIRPTQVEKNPTRYYVSVPLVIQYFPQTQGVRSECHSVASKLFDCLKYVSFSDDMYRGTDLKYDINDDKLNFYVEYNFFVYKRDNTDTNSIDELGVSVGTARKDDE